MPHGKIMANEIDEMLAGAADFGEWCAGANEQKKAEFQAAIDEALEEATDYSAYKFISSCQRQLEEKGFLTEKQVRALKNLENESCGEWCETKEDWEERYEDDYRSGFDIWDFGSS